MMSMFRTRFRELESWRGLDKVMISNFLIRVLLL